MNKLICSPPSSCRRFSLKISPSSLLFLFSLLLQPTTVGVISQSPHERTCQKESGKRPPAHIHTYAVSSRICRLFPPAPASSFLLRSSTSTEQERTQVSVRAPLAIQSIKVVRPARRSSLSATTTRVSFALEYYCVRPLCLCCVCVCVSAREGETNDVRPPLVVLFELKR